MDSDEELLAAARRGDGDAFAVFYRRHVSAITTYLRRRVGCPELAFDLTAETFAAAVQGLAGFRAERGTARGWLFAIAANELRQAWRRRKVEDRARRSLGWDRIMLDDEALERVEAMCADDVLAAALAALPAGERAAIEKRVIDERDYVEVAEDLACSEAVVRQRVSRGLRKLRAALEEQP